jgi:Fic family protein
MPQARFEQRLKNIPDLLWAQIAKIDEQKGQWIAGARLSPQVLGRLKRSVLVTSTGASTRIEGARLSDTDVDKLMSGLVLQRFSDRDKGEVKGYFELLSNVFEAWERIPFAESSIKHLHKELLKYAGKDERHRGNYKKKENKVMMVDAAGKPLGTIFETTPAYLTPKEMQELIDWTRKVLAEKKHHPLTVIGNFIVEFLNIHPFEDGNGRLARILTNLLMLKEGYLFAPYVSHEKLVEADKPGYYLALRQSQRTFDTGHETIGHWLAFFLEIVFQQAKQAVGLLSTENIEKLLSPKQLAIWRYLLTVDEATPLEIAKHAKVARPTVNQALSRLMSFKKVERFGLGRSTRYRKLG